MGITAFKTGASFFATFLYFLELINPTERE